MFEIANFNPLYPVQVLLGFTYYYPLFMAYLWMLGALWFYFRYELGQPNTIRLPANPKVSIVVPCFNEEAHLHEVIEHLMGMNYPNYEVIAVNDGSTDRTGKILEELAATHSRLKVIHQEKNQGKSVGLTTATYLADSDYIIGIDGDALLDHDAIPLFLQHFISSPRVGAVTGNPRIRTRSTLLGRLQVGEFSSLVGLIKRAQRVFYRQLFTASGVITAFRRSAIEDVGYWSQDMLTEDMDITWKLQLRGWDVRFEPKALAWILMPETFRGLWKQRLRWAMGGLQIIEKYKGIFRDWRNYPLWPLFIEHVLSVIWACSVCIVLGAYGFDLVKGLYTWLLYDGMTTAPSVNSMTALLPEYSGVIIGSTCLLQMLVSLLMDKRYDHQLMRYYLWTIWYPFGFWIVNMLTIIIAIPKTLLRKRGLRARWVSPDRGITLKM